MEDILARQATFDESFVSVSNFGDATNTVTDGGAAVAVPL